MKADVYAIGKLFSDDDGPSGFAAPFHQRPYRWGQKRNWEPFWKHWLASVDAALRNPGAKGGKLNFLGAIVCRDDPDAVERDGPDGAVRRLEVLDGQQRLLTAMMATQALRLHALQLGLTDLAAELADALFDAEKRPRFVAGRASYADQMAALRTETPASLHLPHAQDDAAPTIEESLEPPQSDLDAGGDLFELLDQKLSDGAFQAEAVGDFENDDAEAGHDSEVAAEEDEIFSEASAEADWVWDDASGAGSHRLRTALAFFYARIAGRLSKREGADADGGAADELKRLANGLLLDSAFVMITLEGDVSPFDVFERLNNLGEPLSALDLLKNQIFRAAERGGLSRADLEGLYRAEWRVFDDARHTRFWAGPERRGRDTRPTQDWFLRAYLSVREARNVPMSETSALFGKMMRDAADKAPSEIKALCEGARAYAEIGGHLDLGPHRERIQALRRFARFATEPALIAMRMHLWENEDATSRVLQMLESVAVRRFFAGVGGGKDYDIYARLARVIGPGAAAEDRLCVQAVEAELLTAQRGAFWPRDGAFKRDFATKKLVNRNANQQARDRKAVFRAVFEALDGIARGDGPSEEHSQRHEGRTVEHLFPLHGHEEWPDLSRGEMEMLEMIGNLTLVDDEVNKLMGAAPWGRKRELLALDTGVRLNADLLASEQWKDGWGPVQIRERGRILAGLAVKRWPRPK